MDIFRVKIFNFRKLKIFTFRNQNFLLPEVKNFYFRGITMDLGILDY